MGISEGVEDGGIEESGEEGSSAVPEGEPDRIRIMVVDDHQMFAESVEATFRRQKDFEMVGLAMTVADGIELAARTTPDIAVIDYWLPDGDGTLVAQGIAEASPETAMVMLTGGADEQVFKAAMDAGCIGFVTKDRAFEELVVAVRSVRAGQPHLPPDMLGTLLPRLKKGYQGLGSDLTDRELEVLKLLGDGLSMRAIAKELVLSIHTVRNHVQNVLSKMQAHTQLEAVTAAVREGIISRDGTGTIRARRPKS